MLLVLLLFFLLLLFLLLRLLLLLLLLLLLHLHSHLFKRNFCQVFVHYSIVIHEGDIFLLALDAVYLHAHPSCHKFFSSLLFQLVPEMGTTQVVEDAAHVLTVYLAPKQGAWELAVFSYLSPVDKGLQLLELFILLFIVLLLVQVVVIVTQQPLPLRFIANSLTAFILVHIILFRRIQVRRSTLVLPFISWEWGLLLWTIRCTFTTPFVHPKGPGQ